MNGMRANWNVLGVVVAVVAVVVVGLLIANQYSIANLLPFLLILACPLMMILMMGSMGHHHHTSDLSGSDQHHDAAAGAVPDLRGLSHDEQVRALRGELTRMSWRQEALRQDLERLEAASPTERVEDAKSARAGR